MNQHVFSSYLELGWHHIISASAIDHISFIVTLCALFTFTEWRKIVTLVTAFTIGHSVTLALTSLNYLPVSAKWVEILIPITIIITAIRNILQKQSTQDHLTFDKRMIVYYLTALFFGFIHGMGFANSFKIMSGAETSILTQLFAFNCGIELGQLLIVVGVLTILFLMTKYISVKPREWNLFVSGTGFGIGSMVLMNVICG